MGIANATWPFATLRASSTALVLKVALFGTFQFSPEQVVDIEPYYSLPIVGKGVRIRHSVPAYPERLIFWCFVEPKEVVAELKRLGYGPSV
jgi:hypothetical protein